MTNTNTWNFTTNAEGRSIWQLVNNAGDIIGQSSQSFASKAGAEYNAKLLGYKESFSKQLNWDFFQLNNLWHWTCNNSVNKEEVGKSYNGFDSEAEAMDNANLFGFDSNSYTMKSVVISPVESVSNEVPTVAVNAEAPKSKNNFGTPNFAGGIAATNIQKTTPANVDFKASNTTRFDEKVNVNDEGWLVGFWKWLLPLLLVLAAVGLLWWLLNGMNKNTGKDSSMNMPKINSSSLSSANLSTPSVNSNILGVLEKPEFSTLSTAIKASGLEGTLNGFGTLTLLAPTNNAFEKLPEDAVTGLLKADKLTDLKNLLSLHVLPGNVDLSKVTDGQMIKTLSGQELKASVVDGKLSIGGADGIDLSTYSKEGNITIYGIPTVLTVSENETGKAIVKESSAVAISSVAPVVQKTEEKSTENKVGYFINAAKADGRFGTLLSLVKLAGLESALDQAGPFTVFAPTDEAFASLGEEALTTLQKPENKSKLVEILKYHVVTGKNDFAKFGANSELVTLNGNKVTLGLDDHGQGIVKGSKNTALAPLEDINTDNAIIHILTDTVLLQ